MEGKYSWKSAALLAAYLLCYKVLDSAALPAASTDEHFFSYRNKLRKTSLKLCMTHDILPSALILRGVQCSSPEQVGAGAFSDVFVGTFDGQQVALKRLRVYLMVAPSRRLAMKRVWRFHSSVAVITAYLTIVISSSTVNLCYGRI